MHAPRRHLGPNDKVREFRGVSGRSTRASGARLGLVHKFPASRSAEVGIVPVPNEISPYKKVDATAYVRF